jgi:hypothetical protein
MFLPVANIPEQYLYRLVPQGVIDLDKRSLIEAVMGGYQDRTSDLRSYVNSFTELMTPDANLPQLGFNVVLVKFTGPAGQVATRSLDFTDTTPSLDDNQALIAWAASQMDVEQSTIVSVAAGTDVLRRVDVDSISLLAANVGALLYPGLGEESAESQRQTRQRLLETWFPRLKIKGTAKSYEVLGRIIGFEDVAVTPLWSRLVPHLPNDPGNSINDEDFSAKPEQTPSASLPDPRYAPLDFSDGPFYDWASGPLSESAASSNYWPLAVNNRNPFIKIAVLGTVDRPVAGRYTLQGGAPNRKATVLLTSGTHVSNLRADAVADGESFNGLRVNVIDFGGTAAGLSISDRMSAVKYRASYFDFKATIVPSGTEPAQPSPDLEKIPYLTADGTAQAPYRPWTGGSIASAVTYFPDVQVQVGSMVKARVQAAGTTPQFDEEQFDEAERAVESLDTLRAATRRIRSTGVGVAFSDEADLAAYASSTTLFVSNVGTFSGVGTYEGSVNAGEAPTPPYQVTLQAFIGSQPRDTFMDALAEGTVSVAGDGFLGVYRTTDNYYRILVSAGQFGGFGSMKAFFTADVGTRVRSEPSYQAKAAGTVAFIGVPEDEFDNGTHAKTSLYDENPWRRVSVLGGVEHDSDLYLPNGEDLSRKPANPPYQALALSGRQYQLAVLDGSKRSLPYRFKVLQTSETDPITGEAIEGPYSRMLYALDQSDALYPVLLIDDVLVSTQYWSPAKWANIAQWTPFNEHPQDSIQPFSRYAQSVDSNIRHYNRLWDSTRGWYTRFEREDSVAFSADLPLGTAYALAFWLKTENSNIAGSPTTILNLSNQLQLRLTSTGGSTLQLYVAVNGVLTLAASAAITLTQWRFVAVRVDGTKVELGVGSSVASISWTAVSLAVDEIVNQNIQIQSVARTFGIHDFTMWSATKTDDELESLRAPVFQATPVPYPTPYVESLSRDNRYVMRLVASGFAYPSADEVVLKAYNPEYVQNYDFEGLFRGDSRFKQVGLGDGDPLQGTYPLGLRGIEIEGYGRTLVSGSNPPLPGYNDAWGPVAGTTIRVVPPFGGTGGSTSNVSMPASPWPNLTLTNPAQDRIYVEGDDGLVYKVSVDDLGSGPALKAERTLRAVVDSGTVPSYHDEPTDAETVLGSPGKRLSVLVSGTTFSPYEKTDAGQTKTTPPVYLYCQSQVKVNALSTSTAYARWANQNSFGQANGVPALDENGSLDFANSETLPSGVYQLSFDIGNIGTVDDEFDGFSTTIGIVGSGGTVLASIASTLLRDGRGTDPRGIATVNLTLPTPISSSWLLTVDWNNDRDVPRKGQKRQMAIYGYELRYVAPALYQVSINPLTLTLVNIYDTSVVRPGGLYAEINSYGTAVAIRHEAAIYPSNSDWPLSNLATTSSWRRRESIRVVNPSIEPNPSAPEYPTVVSVAPTPNNLYNLGETASLQAQMSGSGTIAAFVWRFWDETVQTTVASSTTKLVTPGVGSNFAGSFSVSAIDRLGNQTQASSVVLINKPPTLNVSATRNVGIFPYITQVNGTTSDPEGHTIALSWLENGTQIATGNQFLFTAARSTTLIGRAVDQFGGVTERRLAFDGSPHVKPIVSPIIRPDTARISNTNEVSFSVYALDPNIGGPLTFLWQHWNGTSAGTTTQVNNSNMKFNQVTIGLAGQTPGTKTIRVTVTDQENYAMVVQTTIDLLANVAPVIASVTTPSPGAMAGDLVPFAAVAIDSDGDAPGYTWNFTSPRNLTLYGGNILFPSLISESGTIIQGTLTVDDSNGSSVSAEIPPVFLATQFIQPLTVSSVPGFYQTGFNQTITTPTAAVIIRYSLDGTDIFRITDGIEYTGQFAFLPPSGGTGIKILKARAFKVGFAPSPQFTGEYQFYDPNAAAAEAEIAESSTSTVTNPVAVQSNTDTVLITTEGANIPGDNKTVTANPADEVPGMSASSLANEPQLPFTPSPMVGSVDDIVSGDQFVTLKAPI